MSANSFFAESLGLSGAPNLYEDWGRLVDARAMNRESAWTAPEAFLCILVGAAVCDHSFSNEERELVRVVAHRSRGLRTLSETQLDALHWLVVHRLSAGPIEALDGACAALPDELKLPAFAHALDIALTDAALGADEAAYLDRLLELLDLDPSLTRPIADAIVLKNRC